MIKATDLLLNRQSNGLLTEPAPDAEALDFILQTGMRVPDHGGLTPWHFTVVKEQGLQTLSDIFVNATADEDKKEKAKNMPFRAPMMIVVSTRYQSHDKVPQVEQYLAAGCCVHAMQMAAQALGYGAIWRTGDMAYSNQVKSALKIAEQDDIVGFLYIGSNQKTMPLKPRKHYQDFVSYL